MAKRVVIIGSGESERRTLPLLLRHLGSQGVESVEVRVPPGGGQLTVDGVSRIIRAAHFELLARGEPATKFVVLADANGGSPDEKIAEFDPLVPRVQDLGLPVLVAAAKWHLEAWFFGDAERLRNDYLGGKALPRVDTNRPDTIENPKELLRPLVPGGVYTARVAEEIASVVNAETVRQRSPSFADFEGKVLNGGS